MCLQFRVPTNQNLTVLEALHLLDVLLVLVEVRVLAIINVVAIVRDHAHADSVSVLSNAQLLVVQPLIAQLLDFYVLVYAKLLRKVVLVVQNLSVLGSVPVAVLVVVVDPSAAIVLLPLILLV